MQIRFLQFIIYIYTEEEFLKSEGTLRDNIAASAPKLERLQSNYGQAGVALYTHVSSRVDDMNQNTLVEKDR